MQRARSVANDGRYLPKGASATLGSKTARVVWVGLAFAMAVVGYSAPLAAWETQTLPAPQPVSLHSSVVVSALPPGPSVRDSESTQARTIPRRRPNPEALSASNPSLRETVSPPLVASDAPVVSADVSPPGVTASFEGVTNLGDNVPLTGFSVVPSDATLGVGPSHVFQIVNIVGRITNKSGGAALTFTLRSFFQIDADAFETDPQVKFDALSQHWFATIVQFSDVAQRSSIVVAVSVTSDPTGTFCLLRLGNPTFETFAQDFPQLGINDDKVIMTYNGFTFADNFLGAGYYALNKAALVQNASSGCQPLPIPAVRVTPNPLRYGIFPAQSLSNTSRLHMAMNANGSGTSNQLVLFGVDGTPGVTPVVVNTSLLPIRLWPVPPLAVQAGSPVGVDTGDASVITAVWQNGSLWIGGNEGCVPGGDGLVRSCLRLIEIQTATPSVAQDMTFSAAGQYYYFPALSPDSSGNLFAVFNASSSSSFVGVRVTGRRVIDPPNTLAAAKLLRGGGGAQTDPTRRMGDYYGAALDPADPSQVWVIAEYVRSTAPRDWGTFVARLTFGAVTSPTLELILNASTFHGGDALIVGLTVSNGGGPLTGDLFFGVALAPAAGPPVGCPSGDAAVFASGGLSTFVIRCLSGSPASFPRLATSVVLPGGLPPITVGSFFTLIWPPVPPGVYAVFMVFTVPGALTDGSVDPGDIIIVAVAPLTFLP